MKISLFGGAFDPPHLGHQKVVSNLLKKEIADEVWFVPVFKHPWAKMLHKEHLLPYEERVAMLQILASDFSSKNELSQKVKIAHYQDISFTYDILNHFSKLFPDHEFSWIMGSEYLSKFDKFLEMHPKLIDYKFYIYPRAGYDFFPIYQNMVCLEEMPKIEISSTMVRKLVMNNQDYSNYVLPKVKDYIDSKGFYKRKVV